jgi:hypothetical protein
MKRSMRKSILKRKYGLTREQVEAMVESHESRCAICGVSMTREHRKSTSAQIDHCHATGQVREILCSQWNNGPGCFPDDPAPLPAAAVYLAKHRSIFVTTEQQAITLPRRDLVAASEGSTGVGFAGAADFALTLRVAACLSQGDFVPDNYRDQIEVNGVMKPNPRAISNCVVALELANRLGVSWLTVMQNLYVVHGRPGWMSQFVITTINGSGRFHSLRFDLTGTGDDRQCVAWTCEKRVRIPDNVQTLADAIAAKLPVLAGTAITWAMVKAEGWLNKKGSKWATMSGQMFCYRAAAFWGRIYAPELLMGFRTAEEQEDMAQNSNGERAAQVSAALNANGHTNGTNGNTAEQPPDAPPGAPAPKPEGVPSTARTTKERLADIEQLERLNAHIDRTKWDGLPTYLKNRHKAHPKELTTDEMEALIAHVRPMPDGGDEQAARLRHEEAAGQGREENKSMSIPDTQRMILRVSEAAHDEADRIQRVQRHAMTDDAMEQRVAALGKLGDNLKDIARRCAALGAPPIAE